MNRTSPKYKGVWQTCTDKCPADRCREHRWTYLVELPAGPDGKRRQVKKGGYASAKDAADARAEVLSQHRAGTLPADRSITVAAWLRRWLATQNDVKGLRPGTIEGYRQHIDDYWVPRLGTVKLADLRPQQVTDALAAIRAERETARAAVVGRNAEHAAAAALVAAERAAKGQTRRVAVRREPVPRPFSPSTASLVRATLRAALNAAMKAGEVTRNAAALAEVPKVRRAKVRPWQPAQLGAFLDAAAGERLYPLFLLGAFSGLRRGELCALSWDDLDLNGRVVTVRWQHATVKYQVIRGKPKSRDGEDRMVDLGPATVAALQAWRKVQVAERLAWGAAYARPVDDHGRPLDLLFTREDGSAYHPEYVYRVFVRLVRREGLPAARLHDLRHVASSLELAAGVDMAIISKRRGHSTLTLTSDTYSHLVGTVGAQAAHAAEALVPRQQNAG